MSRGPIALAIVAVSTLACLQTNRPAPAAPPPALDVVQELSERFQEVSARAAESVVGVRSIARRGDRFRSVAQGSGLLVRPDGTILTNAHVVRDGIEFRVTLLGGREVRATFVGRDDATDLAVLDIEGDGWPYLELERNRPARVGEWAIAVGNPLGFSHTVTAGIVSGTGRDGLQLATYEDFLQTDAAINPGNSGGPLLSLEGRVLGVNTAVGLPASGASGMGFAIPVHLADFVLERLLADGEVVRGYLGVDLSELDPDQAEDLGLGFHRRVMVTTVLEGTPAARAGLVENDVVLGLGESTVASVQDLMARIARHRPGTTVTLDVLRRGRKREIDVRLGERPAPAAR